MKSARSIAINNKRKGKKFEADIVKILKASGFVGSKRAWGSNGNAIGEHAEVDVAMRLLENDKTTQDLLIQCKNFKQIRAELLPTEHVDMVVFKQERGEPHIVMPLDRFLQYFTVNTPSLQEVHVRDLIVKLLDYMYVDEKHSYEESEESGQDNSNHIFLTLKRLKFLFDIQV